MSRKNSEYTQIIELFQQLNKKYPSYSIGRHVATALADYTDVWGVSDKEFLFALTKYSAELEMNVLSDDDKFLQKVIADAEHIFDEDGLEDEFGEDEFVIE